MQSEITDTIKLADQDYKLNKKTKMEFKSSIKKPLAILILISSVTLISCSDKLCSAYARSEDRVYSMQKKVNSRNGASSIASPFNQNYKASIQKKYRGL